MKISIVTPNYNYAAFIGKTIESVIRQNYNNYEYIIVDDGSTDNSVQVIKQYTSKYPNHIFLIEQENKGQTSAINTGMKRITGDIVCWINSDDTFCEQAFSKVVECFYKNNTLDVVFGDMNVMDINEHFIYRRRHLNFNYVTGCLLGFTTILSSNAVFWKKTTMEKSGLFNENLKCNMDGDFFARLCKNIKIKKINFSLANFRKQPHTKASESNPKWDELVKREVLQEREMAYHTLMISKILPFKYVALIRIPYQIVRIVKRLLLLHFYKKKKEISFYNKTTATNQ